MEIILKQPVRNLGDEGDIVKVKAGYARNFLIPQGFAVMATESTKRDMEAKRQQAAHKQEYIKQQAQEEAEKLQGLEVTIETLAGADGKLFGSVTAIQIAARLKEQGYEVDRKTITLDDIRQTGDYTAIIHLHKEVKAEIEIHVIRQEN